MGVSDLSGHGVVYVHGGTRRWQPESHRFTLTLGNPVQVTDMRVPPDTVDFEVMCEPYTNQAGDEAPNADPPDGTDMSAAEKIPLHRPTHHR